MSSAVAGYTGSLGSDGPPASYADIDQADFILVLGSNTSACHPIVWSRIQRRRQAGAHVCVIDPRRTPTAEQADSHLAGPARRRPAAAQRDARRARHGGPGRPRVRRAPHRGRDRGAGGRGGVVAGARCGGVRGAGRADRRRPPAASGGARRALVLWSMGANQSTVGTLKNQALINLCLATGNIGRRGSGPLSLTGQPNAMGGRESGGLAHLLPGYRLVTDPEHRAEMRRLWDIPPARRASRRRPGIAATELVEALEEDRVKVVWIVATNPVVSQPDAARFAAALRRAELVIVQDAYHPTETGALAHVILPAAQWAEKDGTQTNSERRVGLMRRMVDPPGDALPDWEIFARVGRALGHQRAVRVEDAPPRSTPSTSRRPRGGSATRAGCRTSGSSARVRCSGRSRRAAWTAPTTAARSGSTPAGVSRRPTAARGWSSRRTAEPAEAPSAEHPLVLTTGRVAHQWHTMTRTSKAKDLLAAEPEPFVEVHPEDARRAGVDDGEQVLLRSAHGRATVRARVTDRVAEGVAFAPFHWGALHLEPGAGALNAVVGRAIDPTSKQAELKATPVRIEPVASVARDCGSARAATQWRLAVSALRGGGWSSSAAAWPGWRPSRRCSATPTPPTGRSRSSGPSRSRPTTASCCRSLLAGAVGAAELALRHPQWLAAARRGAAARRARAPRRHRGAHRRTGRRRDAGLRRPRPGHRLAPVRPADPRRRPRRRPRLPHARRRARDRRRRGHRQARGRHRRRPARPGGGTRPARARGARDRRPSRRPADGAAARRARLVDAGTDAARAADRDADGDAHRGAARRRGGPCPGASCWRVERSCGPTWWSSPRACGRRSTSPGRRVWRSSAGSSSTTSCARVRRASVRSASALSTAERSTGCGRRCWSRPRPAARRSPLARRPSTVLRRRRR